MSWTPADPSSPSSSPSPPSPSNPSSPPFGSGSVWIAPAAVLLGLLVGIFVTLFIEIVGSAFGSSVSNPTAAVSLIADFGFDLSFVGAALYFTVLHGGLRSVDFGYRRIPLLKGVGAVVAAGAIYYGVSAGYSALFALHGTDKLPSELGVTHSTAATVGAAVFVCVAAPMAEEFFFRGFLFGVLRRMRVRVAGRELGPWIAALIVSFLFGLAHTGSASSQYLIPLGLLGFALCMVRWRTGSLYPCMALHSLNNSVALGVNELSWGAGPIIALAIGALVVIALLTGPLSRGTAARAQAVG
jgi:uncharacterized protein